MSDVGRRAEAAVDVGRAWLDTLHELGRPAAHEIRNALNGVAVNLEVVRARAARPGAAAADVARFADAAAEQLESLASLADALLALVRPVAEPADASAVVARLTTLLGAVARADGGAVTLAVSPGAVPVRTAMRGDALRALVAAVLLAALERGEALACELDGGPAPTLRLRRAGSPLPSPPQAIVALAEQEGARLESGADAWVVVLPPAGERAGGA